MTLQCHIAHPDHHRVPSGFGKVIRCALESEGSAGDDITVILCDDGLSGALNREFLGRNRPTDVLSFELGEPGGDRTAGEIYVNLDRARRQALDYGVSFWNELARLAIHGLLHLYNYHDRDDSSKDRMVTRQEELLNKCFRPLHW
jgi:probable rRNA maturation factor